jgi:hypothetical protein
MFLRKQQCWLMMMMMCCTCNPALSLAGAYQGRGRGNAFLNDLCDADVLVHVVDCSGTTDNEGAATAAGEGEDPRREVA